MKVYGVLKGVKWRMQGEEFEGDFQIMEVRTYAMVLGFIMA